MIHLYLIPVIIVAVIVWLVSVEYNLNLFRVISKIVIIIGVILFIYFYLDYRGFNIIVYLRRLIHI